MAYIYNITCDQGATFSRVITYKDSDGALVNLTGYTARMHVRAQIEAPSPDVSPLIALTTTNGRITLGGALGTVTLSISAADTAALSAGTYYYDLEMVSGDSPVVVTRLIQGTFVVDPEVTR